MDLLIILTKLMTWICLVNCDTKVWTFTIEIDNPVNWIGGKVQEDCNGLVFSKNNDLPMLINKLNIKQLVLPITGNIIFEEGSLVFFDEGYTDGLNCVEVIPLFPHYSSESNFWRNLDNPDNPAVPISERLPCKYDDIVFPKGFNSSITFVESDIISVNSVTFGNEKLTQGKLSDLFKSGIGEEVFSSWFVHASVILKIKSEECTDPTGCDRRAFVGNLYEPPNLIRPCYDNIDIIGNIGEPICGAQILINSLKPGFTIDKINKKLKEYGSYTHASKYEQPSNKMQIIFTEKEFTGSSLIEATEFYNILQEDVSYFCEDITLKMSGPALSEKDAHIKNALSITFGTLLGVILMFGLLFFVYSPTVSNLHLRNRFLSARPLSTYILRYDNMEDRAEIIDGQSMAGSVLALNRSFENPLYEQSLPSMRSTNDETVTSLKLEKGDETRSEKAIVLVLDAAKELEDINLVEKDEVLLKDL